MKFIGAHVSISKGVENAPLNAAAIGAAGFAMFTKNQRQWSAPAISAQSAAKFRENCAKHGFTADMILPHDSYLINLGQPDPVKRENALKAFIDELKRCAALGLTMLNFHPGSHLKLVTEKEGCLIIADSVKTALEEVPGVCAVFENTAGQGSNLGYTFEQLADMLEAVGMPERTGVCIDTCHAYAAGYDLATNEGFEKTFDTFDRLIGLKNLRGMHLNDSKGVMGGKLDRHSPLGAGTLGMGLFEKIAADSRFDNIPLILETPDESLWSQEIAHLRQIATQRSAV
ncbi:MAG: deoxyribonuclease IV [Lentisphaerae bacterium]|nr:deoxyribonuclease IV [Lentisphaerota bacterium]